MMKPEIKCGFFDVRPIKGHPGRYVCSVCSKVMREDWPEFNNGAQMKEVSARESIPMPAEAIEE